MTKCTHCETCEECFEANRKLKAEAAVKNELRKEIADLLGVSHLRGEPQLRAAAAAIKTLERAANEFGKGYWTVCIVGKTGTGFEVRALPDDTGRHYPTRDIALSNANWCIAKGMYADMDDPKASAMFHMPHELIDELGRIHDAALQGEA